MDLVLVKLEKLGSMKEITIDHKEISDTQTITDVNIRKFKEHGLDIHQHEVKELVDDHAKGKRILKIKNTRYFDMGRRG